MIKTLMHKNIPVCKIKVDEQNMLESIMEVYNEQYLPENTNNLQQSLGRWLMLRKVSFKRDDLSSIREFYGSSLFISHSMRSLEDCYWLKCKDTDTWENISPYNNWEYFNDDIYLALYDPEDYEAPFNDSPNLTLSGTNKCIWYKNKENEIGTIDSNIQNQLYYYRTALKNDITIVKERIPVILCSHLFAFTKSSTSEQVESIPFDHLYNTTFDINLSKEANLQKCCETFNIPNWEAFFNELIKYDQICGKSDRELIDIRVLRNADNLQIIGFDKL